MVQRLPDKHDDGEAYARWEGPGGRLDDTDASVWAGALREWTEETGATLPEGSEPCGGWIDDDEDYEGFVVKIPHEADLTLDPEHSEISSAKWWDPDDLDDPKVRDKVVEQLGDIHPLLKSKWEDFHENTDRLLDEYAPEVRDALACIFEADSVRSAMQTAFTGVQKARAPGSWNKPNYLAQLRALIGTAVQQGMNLLRGGPKALQRLREVLRKLYTAAYSEGAREAAAAVGVAPELGPGLAQLLANLDIVLTGIADTLVNRIGEAVQEAMQGPVDMAQLAAKVDAIINDEARAMLIAETEYARARTLASREIYRRNNILDVRWLHQPGACELCLENAAVSPLPINDSWPNGNVPVHPNCRCVEAPEVRVPPRRVMV